MNPVWLLILLFCVAWASLPLKCSFAQPDLWLSHCEAADDCTSEAEFCGCCAHHPSTEYAEACVALCPVLSGKFEFSDFSSNAIEKEIGPYFTQPSLSLVGDAAVVLGDCYNLDLRVSDLADGSQQACLTPPVPERIFTPFDMSICPNKVAPFHMESGAEIANLLCFEECAGIKEQRAAPVELPFVDDDSLFIANCTRSCFIQCAALQSASCASNCKPSDYDCFMDCHARENLCKVPLGPRSLSSFKLDPNELVCKSFGPAYEGCVTDCNVGCHAQLKELKVTPQDKVNTHYSAQCTPPLLDAMKLATHCLSSCAQNCTTTCGPLVAATADPCGDVCSSSCLARCNSRQQRETYFASCMALPQYNCSALCLTERCVEVARFCGVYDERGRLHALDLGCNATSTIINDQWVNSSISEVGSDLSLHLGINATRDVCYRECGEHVILDWQLTGADAPENSFSCETRCYDRVCLNLCLGNCSHEEALPACALEPLAPAGFDRGRRDLWNCTQRANCSCEAAWAQLAKDSHLNVSELSRSDPSVILHVWDEQVCEDVIDRALTELVECARCEFCVQACAFPRTLSGAMSPEIGPCLRSCRAHCLGNCTEDFQEAVHDSSNGPCKPPSPADECVPPPNCTRDCSDSCLDASYLVSRPNCDLNVTRIIEALGTSAKVVTLPYTFNRTSQAQCRMNVSTIAECPSELIFFNVTQVSAEIPFGEDCVQACYDDCTARCFKQYCVHLSEYPVNETATCMPRCLSRFLGETTTHASIADAGVPNATACILNCTGNCQAMVELNCTRHCEPVHAPPMWQACHIGCVRNASHACSQACVYECTGDHMFAFGFPEPYDPDDDLVDLDWFIDHFDLSSAGDALRFEEFLTSTHMLGDATAQREPLWSNASARCYTNCSLACGSKCFDTAFERCKQQLKETEPGLLIEGHDPRDGKPNDAEEEARRSAVVSLNNCTIVHAELCLDSCTSGCLEGCRDLQDGRNTRLEARDHQKDVITPEELLVIQEAELLEGYVSECEEKCRITIFGRNVTTEEVCLGFYPDYFEGCMRNCTEVARLACTDYNNTLDIKAECNSTCTLFTIREAEAFAAALLLVNATESEEDGKTVLSPVFDNGAVHRSCMSNCSADYVNNNSYVCDGGQGRVVAVAKLENATADAIADGGIDPVEQMNIDQLSADVPLGELCARVHDECLHNNSLLCADPCSQQLAFYQELCFRQGQAQRSTSHDYNISSCIAPGGWKVGEPKWIWFSHNDPSNPLALEPFDPSDVQVWEYTDILDDLAILNCTCHFLNGTWDPTFVTMMLEYNMRPFRVTLPYVHPGIPDQHQIHIDVEQRIACCVGVQDHYVSTCFCVFNASVLEPQRCIHSNFTVDIFSWTFGNASAGLQAEEDPVQLLREEWRNCTIGCVPDCYHECDAFFLEEVYDVVSNEAMLVPRPDVRGSIPQSLYGYDDNGTRVAGFWNASARCLRPCLGRCVANCSADCLGSCRQNETASAFGCTYQAAVEEGLPQCARLCECGTACASRCVDTMIREGLNASWSSNMSSAEQARFLPECQYNCSAECVETHVAYCENVSMVVSVPMEEEPYVNETAICLAKVWPTCAFYCLSIGENNTNASLFPVSLLPDELLYLEYNGSAQGYKCQLEPCEFPEAGVTCNLTVVQIGENVTVDEYGNVTVVPILRNVTASSAEQCALNRNNACLHECHSIGYQICVPKIEPFDLCVQSCISNLTYQPPASVYNHSVMVCKKQLRLTPSLQSRTGAAWHQTKQMVQRGFKTSFEFRVDHGSQRCVSVDHPNHDERPEDQTLCQFRGGEGFAFVLQDSGHTNLEPICPHECLVGCVNNLTVACRAHCREPCPQRQQQHLESCAKKCTAGLPSELPHELIEAVPSLRALASLQEAAVEAAAADCSPDLRACVAACPDAHMWSEGVLSAGCVRECLDARSRLHCEARCPLVDEDLDFNCIEGCTEGWVNETTLCLSRCTQYCEAQSALVLAACEGRCESLETLLPSGESLDYCLELATAHPIHESALCLTNCKHDDTDCLKLCAESPPNAALHCVDACPRDNTRCVTQCLEQRVELARECIMPCVYHCGHSSTALGAGDEGLGYAKLGNALVFKFDTWYNPDANDLHINHVAVHASGHAAAPIDTRLALGVAVDLPNVADGRPHKATITYSPSGEQEMLDSQPVGTPALGATIRPGLFASNGGEMAPGLVSILIDGAMVLQLPLVLEDALELDKGKVFVGFTAATGTAYQEHLITHWDWQST